MNGKLRTFFEFSTNLYNFYKFLQLPIEYLYKCVLPGSNHPEWGEARLDRRGILVGEMVARNDLIVLNQGKEFTFRRGARG